jgi:lipopolysaccharide biosynthesis protein
MHWLILFRLRNLARTLWGIAWMYPAAAVGLCRRRRDYVVERQPGERSLVGAKRVAVFVHYDRRGRVHDYVLHYLRCLRGGGFEIVFVSNAPTLRGEARDRLKPLCALILRRRNVGYDFGAYKDGIAALGNIADFDELLLVNDSVYGPFSDLGEIIARCDRQRAAVWGITDNWFRRFHLQSYFLLFKAEALTSPAFGRFWNSVDYVQSKRWITERYEIGLSQFMIQNELRCTALYPYREAAQALAVAVAGLHEEPEEGEEPRAAIWNEQQRFAAILFDAVERGLPLNSTHHLWDYLIGEMSCPFLKRELLERNPMKVPALRRWEALLREKFDYDTDLILRHLEAQARNRAV